MIPAELLELKARFETWGANRKYVREPMPDELCPCGNAAAQVRFSRWLSVLPREVSNQQRIRFPAPFDDLLRVLFDVLQAVEFGLGNAECLNELYPPMWRI